MKDRGYVYILINPSMENLVKIGKSSRNPLERAKELSSTTGIPTPFIHIYDCYFSNCTLAERYVHTILENKGYRVSRNREFFELPIKDAINAILGARDHFGTIEPTNNSDDLYGTDNFYDEITNPAKELFNIGNKYFAGAKEELQDYNEAIKYYRKSLRLGHMDANHKLGVMYKLGLGVASNMEVSLKFFKEGAKLGDERCFAEMAEVFNIQDSFENAQKSWDNYLKAIKTFDNIYLISYLNFRHKYNLKRNYEKTIQNKKDELVLLLKEELKNIRNVKQREEVKSNIIVIQYELK